MTQSILDWVKSTWLNQLRPGEATSDRYSESSLKLLADFLKEEFGMTHNEFARMKEDTRLELPHPHGPKEFQGKPVKRVTKYLLSVRGNKLTQLQTVGLSSIGEKMEAARTGGIAPKLMIAMFDRIWFLPDRFEQKGKCCYYPNCGWPHYRDMFAARDRIFALTFWKKHPDPTFMEPVMEDCPDFKLPEEFRGYEGAGRLWLAFDKTNPNALYVTNDFGPVTTGSVASFLAEKFGFVSAGAGYDYGIGDRIRRMAYGNFTLHLHNVFAVAPSEEELGTIDPNCREDNWNKAKKDWKLP